MFVGKKSTFSKKKKKRRELYSRYGDPAGFGASATAGNEKGLRYYVDFRDATFTKCVFKTGLGSRVSLLNLLHLLLIQDH